jgi:diadenosine tetraphosphate (Ap4A) HIT family hydrolase
MRRQSIPQRRPRLRRSQTCIGGGTNAQGMNLVTSAGEAATQTVFHLHVHVLPRWDGDALEDFWPDVPTTAEAELDELAEALRQYLAG